MNFNDFITKAKALGFEEVLSFPFAGGYDKEEKFIILFRDGILMVLSSFQGDAVNKAEIYYNAKITGSFDFVSSGSLVDGVWVGHQDIRDYMESKINNLVLSTEVLSKWIRQPSLWLLHYMDTKGDYNYEAINEERIAMLPQYVRDCICPEPLN